MLPRQFLRHAVRQTPLDQGYYARIWVALWRVRLLPTRFEAEGRHALPFSLVEVLSAWRSVRMVPLRR